MLFFFFLCAVPGRSLSAIVLFRRERSWFCGEETGASPIDWGHLCLSHGPTELTTHVPQPRYCTVVWWRCECVRNLLMHSDSFPPATGGGHGVQVMSGRGAGAGGRRRPRRRRRRAGAAGSPVAACGLGSVPKPGVVGTPACRMQRRKTAAGFTEGAELAAGAVRGVRRAPGVLWLSCCVTT